MVVVLLLVLVVVVVVVVVVGGVILGEVKARPKDIISFSLDYISKSKVQTSNPSSSPISLDTPARPADFKDVLQNNKGFNVRQFHSMSYLDLKYLQDTIGGRQDLNVMFVMKQIKLAIVVC